MFRQQFYIITNILMLIDSIILIVTGYLAYSISLEIEYSSSLVMAWNDFLGSLLFVMFVNNYFMGRFGFYSERRSSSNWSMVGSLFGAVSSSFILLATVAILIGIKPFSRIYLVLHFFGLFLLLIILRITLNYYLDNRSLKALKSRQVLFIGTKDRIEPVAEAVDRQPSWGHQIAGWLNVDDRGGAQTLDIPLLGKVADFENVLQKYRIDEVVFALPGDFPVDLEIYLRKCEELGLTYRIVPGLFDASRPSLRVETLQGIPTLTAYSGSATASGLLYKKILDIVVGFLGLTIFIFLYPIVGLAIKLDSPGPVLFKQIRVGRNNRRFYLYKFRSMVADAESVKNELLAGSEMSGPIFKMEKDPRITRLGRFLRKTSIDEIPQFINVLKAEMSLVGTRPPTPDEVEQYEDWHRRRISMKPGITGLWQVSGRNKITDFNEIVKLDLKYIDRWRFRLDLVILWKTVWVVLARKGAK